MTTQTATKPTRRIIFLRDYMANQARGLAARYPSLAAEQAVRDGWSVCDAEREIGPTEAAEALEDGDAVFLVRWETR